MVEKNEFDLSDEISKNIPSQKPYYKVKSKSVTAVRQAVDEDTGELYETEEVLNDVKYESEPQYTKVYHNFINDIGKLNDLNDGEMKVLYQCMQMMGYESNMLCLIKGIKLVMAENCNMALKTVDKHIQSLKKKSLLISGNSRGMYMMNPNYFGKGSWKKNKELRLVIDYHQDGTRSINTEKATQMSLFGDEDNKSLNQ